MLRECRKAKSHLVCFGLSPFRMWSRSGWQRLPSASPSSAPSHAPTSAPTRSVHPSTSLAIPHTHVLNLPMHVRMYASTDLLCAHSWLDRSPTSAHLCKPLDVIYAGCKRCSYLLSTASTPSLCHRCIRTGICPEGPPAPAAECALHTRTVACAVCSRQRTEIPLRRCMPSSYNFRTTYIYLYPFISIHPPTHHSICYVTSVPLRRCTPSRYNFSSASVEPCSPESEDRHVPLDCP